MQIYLTSIRCDEETDEVGADEPYVLAVAVNLASTVNVSGFPVPIPATDVVLYGPFGDVDEGETHGTAGRSRSFWGPGGGPVDLSDPEQAILVVALMENDDGDPNVLRSIVAGAATSAIFSTLSGSRGDKVGKLIRDVDGVLRTPTGAPNFDDKVGGPQELRFTRDELARANAGAPVPKSLGFAGDGGRYTLNFEARTVREQSAWRFCNKCSAMFFDGFPTKGACPRGGGHQAQGFDFVLTHDMPAAPGQREWRFCQKCNAMFFDGFPNKGVCPQGGGHQAQGFNFVLPHDVPGPGQEQWRFCQKCNAMFFNGFPAKGACPRGGGHEAQGFNFRLDHR